MLLDDLGNSYLVNTVQVGDTMPYKLHTGNKPTHQILQHQTSASTFSITLEHCECSHWLHTFPLVTQD